MTIDKSGETGLADLAAAEAARRIAACEVSSAELVEACLKRIKADESRVGAWAFLDPVKAIAQAENCDKRQADGLPLGSLHGVPVGIKDIIDVDGMPTGNGSKIDEGKMPASDATLVSRLRNVGAVILGKTVTTEFAYFHPGKTRNPHDPSRTPGGSSSGSAACVAANMTPLAIGSQTNGSMIRPASFCGVVGYKPSRGSIPLTGVLALSGALDQIGIYGHTIEDVALVETVMGPEPGKLGVNPGPLMATAMSAPLVRPKLGFVRTPYWDHAEPETRSAFEKLVVALGADIEEAPLPEEFASTAGWLRTIMSAEMAHNMGHILDTHPGEMSKVLSDYLNEGRQVAATEYLAARTRQNQLREALAPTFGRFDALLTPAAVGEAIPFDQGSTGDPIFCTIWTFCGLPSVSLPLLKGPNGLPVGVQLVGAPNNDAQLLRTARWLTERLGVPLG